jgi:hypothetical protein
MLVLIAVLLVLLPAAAIVYPFFRRSGGEAPPDDEASDSKDLSRRWDAAVAGLRNTELEFSIGNLTENDYDWLKEQYMTEAALVLKTMELEEHQEQELMEDVERAVRGTREDLEPPEDEQ